MRRIARLSRASGIALSLALTLTADVGAQEFAAATTPPPHEHVSAGRPLAVPQLDDESQVRAAPISDPYLFCQVWKARAKKLKVEIERTESALETATGSERKALQRKLKQLRKELRRAKLEMARWCR